MSLNETPQTEYIINSSNSNDREARKEGNTTDDSFERDEEVDEEYWRDTSHISILDESEDEVEKETISNSERSLTSDKRSYGVSKHEDDHPWQYFSQSKRGWMCKVCKKYPYSSGRPGGTFSVKPCINTEHTSHAFRLRENSKRHQR